MALRQVPRDCAPLRLPGVESGRGRQEASQGASARGHVRACGGMSEHVGAWVCVVVCRGGEQYVVTYVAQTCKLIYLSISLSILLPLYLCISLSFLSLSLSLSASFYLSLSLSPSLSVYLSNASIIIMDISLYLSSILLPRRLGVFYTRAEAVRD